MRFYSYAAAAALGAAILLTPAMPAFAAEQAPAAAQTAPTQVTLPYTYTSQQYGYTIQCPQKPVGVIPASALYEDKKGEVLIFDNDGTLPVDFREVAVTRRLYRSGESEYFINRSRCRLKDIYQLFADTGIGHDGMSIIGQNRMEDILNSRPEDRRAFFEETAGITKFRDRKRETVKKLTDTEANLLRVQDIMQEIETQLEPLARHAEKTRQYNALHEAYQKCKLTKFARSARRDQPEKRRVIGL